MTIDTAEVEELLAYLTDEERAEINALLLANATIWAPLPGPQLMAYSSEADIIGYGGQAGGGKTDLGIGMALTEHENVLILRPEGTQLTAIIERMANVLNTRKGFSGAGQGVWRRLRDHDERAQLIEFGSLKDPGDETKYQGRPHDLKVFDEAANFREAQVRFLLGWLRSTTPGQKCRALLTFNPPTDVEGRWIIDFFAPWLDKKFPDRAAPGELRYAASIPDGRGGSTDLWVDGPAEFVIADGKPVYDFDRAKYKPQDIVRPLSRTFIPAAVTDNPYLASTGYLSMLQSLPEPLRSQMLYGDFDAGISDDVWQVIPTAWVEAAQERWSKLHRVPPMDSIGVDVARGGKDNTVIARRHGDWYDELVTLPGKESPDGPTVAAQVIAVTRDKAPQHIDVIGVGSAVYDSLIQFNQQALGVNVAMKSTATDRSGKLTFANLRSELWWRMREALDPANNRGLALPPDPRLLADLTAPKWRLRGFAIYVESREELLDPRRLGRSPDFATAVILALIETPKVEQFFRGAHSSRSAEYDPLNFNAQHN